jgi:hypothetical protein
MSQNVAQPIFGHIKYIHDPFCEKMPQLKTKFTEKSPKRRQWAKSLVKINTLSVKKDGAFI